MLGSEGRECTGSVQLLCRSQDGTVKMTQHTITTMPNTTITFHEPIEGATSFHKPIEGATSFHKPIEGATSFHRQFDSGTVPHNGATIPRRYDSTVPKQYEGATVPRQDQGTISRQCHESTSLPRRLALNSASPDPSGAQGSDDLTSLSWLHSLDMGGMVPHLAMTPPTPPASPQPQNPIHPFISTHTQQQQQQQQQQLDKKRKLELQEKIERIDYSKDGSKKPPYSYAALIGMAMKQNQNKMTLSAIYKWIRENFAYYKTADPSWQNSIRHNLSLNKCFIKVARSKDEPGKGGFWRLDPEYADTLVDGVFKKRRPTRTTIPPPSKAKKSRKQATQQQVQQQIQQLGIKVVVQPQTAFMPPPTNKPPPRSTIYLDHNGIEIDREVCDSDGGSLKDDIVWSALLGEEVIDETWACQTQELVTDLSQTGDPSTYPTNIPASSTTTLTSHPHLISTNQQFQFSDHQQPQVITITTSTCSSGNSSSPPLLPSLELSPASLGVEDDLFTSPECSEASNDEVDSFASLEINNGSWKGYEQLPSMNSLCNSLTPLAPMEPTHSLPTSAAPVLVQDAHAYWGTDSTWDEKTLPLLDANLDLENLIDLDVVM